MGGWESATQDMGAQVVSSIPIQPRKSTQRPGLGLHRAEIRLPGRCDGIQKCKPGGHTSFSALRFG